MMKYHYCLHPWFALFLFICIDFIMLFFMHWLFSFHLVLSFPPCPCKASHEFLLKLFHPCIPVKVLSVCRFTLFCLNLFFYVCSFTRFTVSHFIPHINPAHLNSGLNFGPNSTDHRTSSMSKSLLLSFKKTYLQHKWKNWWNRYNCTTFDITF